jgi:hypothetical protein
LWQPERLAELPNYFRHMSTQVTLPGDSATHPAGQTFWSGNAQDREAGMAWDWVQISRGVVALADPMAVVTNLRLIGAEGAVLSACEAARYLNEIVRALPWQDEVQRALHEGAMQ